MQLFDWLFSGIPLWSLTMAILHIALPNTVNYQAASGSSSER
jgi:hypothetical protein